MTRRCQGSSSTCRCLGVRAERSERPALALARRTRLGASTRGPRGFERAGESLTRVVGGGRAGVAGAVERSLGDGVGRRECLVEAQLLAPVRGGRGANRQRTADGPAPFEPGPELGRARRARIARVGDHLLEHLHRVDRIGAAILACEPPELLPLRIAVLLVDHCAALEPVAQFTDGDALSVGDLLVVGELVTARDEPGGEVPCQLAQAALTIWLSSIAHEHSDHGTRLKALPWRRNRARAPHPSSINSSPVSVSFGTQSSLAWGNSRRSEKTACTQRPGPVATTRSMTTRSARGAAWLRRPRPRPAPPWGVGADRVRTTTPCEISSSVSGTWRPRARAAAPGPGRASTQLLSGAGTGPAPRWGRAGR